MNNATLDRAEAIRRLKAIAEDYEEIALGYREKADKLMREAANLRWALSRLEVGDE